MDNLFRQFVHIPQFLITWSVFFAAGLFVYATYVIRNRIRFSFKELIEYCVPFNCASDKSFHIDVKIYLIGKMTDWIILTPALFLNAYAAVLVSSALRISFPMYTGIELVFVWAAICTMIMFLTVELSDFLCHYAEHKIPILWELHKVHHSAQFLNPLTSKRGHPLALGLEGIVRALLTAVPGGIFVFIFHMTTVEAVALSLVASKVFVIATLDPLKHSHHPISLGVFDKLLISPHMHQIHHSKTQAHWDKNFGTNLSIFDWLIGTAYKPKKGEAPAYGISGYSSSALQRYNTLAGAYIQPIIQICRILGGTRIYPNMRISSAAESVGAVAVPDSPQEKTA